jgi:hypothetical protein
MVMVAPPCAGMRPLSSVQGKNFHSWHQNKVSENGNRSEDDSLDLHRWNMCSKDMELVLNHSWDKSSEKNKNN